MPDRLRALAQLASARRYDAIADELLSRLVPAQNPFLFWDKFLVLGLDEPPPLPGRPPREPVRATLEDMQLLCAQVPDRAEQFQRRLDDGHECYVLRDGPTGHGGDHIVARQWIVPDRAELATNSGWRFVPPARPAIWMYDLYIDPAYQLRGHFVGFMENTQRERHGVRPHVYAEVHFRNERSLRSCLRYGFEVVCEVTVWTLLGLRLYVARDAGGRRTISARFGFRIPRL